MNRDGYSQPYEISDLKSAGITAIDTQYERLPKNQQGSLFTNVVKYKSVFYGSQCPPTGCASYDVFFTTIDNQFIGHR